MSSILMNTIIVWKDTHYLAEQKPAANEWKGWGAPKAAAPPKGVFVFLLCIFDAHV